MKVAVSQVEIPAVDADLLAVGLCEGEELPAELASAPGAADAKGGFKKLAMLHPERPARVVASASASARSSTPSALRVAAALVAKEGGKLSAELARLGAARASDDDEALAEGLVTGTILGAYRFDRFKSADPDDPAPADDSSR